MNAPTTLRVPPNSIDAEQAVLGGIMLAPEAYWRVADLIGEDDFYRQDHRLIFRAIADLAKREQPTDAVTLGEWFESQRQAQHIGGMAYLLELANTTPSAANIRAHAGIVAQKALERRLIDAGTKIATLGYAGGQDALQDAHKALQAVSVPDASAVRSAKSVLADVVADLQRKCDSESAITGLSTGFEKLDEMTSGFQPGDLLVLAARPAMGKSTLAQNIAERVALRGLRVLFFTQEMEPAQVLSRSIASIGGVPFGALRSPKLLEDQHWSRITDASAKLAKSPLLLDGTCGITLEQIGARARQCHGSAPLSLIVIDYLQYSQLPKGDTLAERVQEMTRGLKQLGKSLGVPVLLLSQLNRGVESRADKRPGMSDLRDSGAIEQDADAVMFMYRDGYYHRDSPHKGFAELILAKQRNGVTGMVPLRERLDEMRFEDCDELPEIPHERPAQNARGFGRFPDRKAAASGE